MKREEAVVMTLFVTGSTGSAASLIAGGPLLLFGSFNSNAKMARDVGTRVTIIISIPKGWLNVDALQLYYSIEYSACVAYAFHL